jgi:hypothetical protein
MIREFEIGKKYFSEEKGGHFTVIAKVYDDILVEWELVCFMDQKEIDSLDQEEFEDIRSLYDIEEFVNSRELSRLTAITVMAGEFNDHH